MYAASGLSIRPKTKISKNEQLTKEALSSPHRTLVDPWDNEIKVLNQVLKQAIIKELQQTQTGIFESG